MIRLSVRRPVAVAMAYFAVALLGVAAWRNIPIELLPDTQLPRLRVEAFLPGASPETTEAFLTSPLESAVQQVRGVERIESVSEERFGRGVASVDVEFSRETEMDFARLELSERLRALEGVLPSAATRPRVTPYVPREFREQSRPFLAYTVSGPYTLEALRAHADDRIVPELLQMDGVAHIQVDGGRARLLEIELDTEKAAALGISPVQLRQRIEDLEYVREAGVVEIAGMRHSLAIRHRAESAAEIRQLPLRGAGAGAVRLGEVAVVRDTYEEPQRHYRIDAQPALTFTVFREPGSNAVAVADRVKERLAELSRIHPSGTRLHLDSDESEAVRTQLSDLRFRAMVSAGVIFVVLLLFLRSFLSAGIVFATIAFSILVTLNLIYWGGFSLNVLTLMGLALGFGLIVDNAIVVLENIYRHRKQGQPAARAAERGAREVILPVLAATATTLVVIVPFVYLQGELRVYYVPLAMVVGFSLLASLFVAFSFIPALAGRVLSAESTSDARAVPRTPIYQQFYGSVTGFTLRFPWLTVLLAAATLGGSYYLFDKHVNKGLLWRNWAGEQSYIDIRIALPRGEELSRTDELVRYFEDRLSAMPEVARFVTNVRPQSADIRVTFPDSLEATFVPVAIKEQMVAFSHLFGGAEVRVYGFGPSFYGGGGSPPNFSIKVLGYNYETVRDIADDLGSRLTRFSRIHEVDTNSSGRWYSRDRASELVLDLDRSALAMYGLSARDVVMQVRSAVAGAEGRSSMMRLGGEPLQYSVKLSGYDRMEMLALQDLLVPSPAGEGVRLGSVATLAERQVLNRIIRENQQYQRVVSYEFRGPSRLGDRVHEAVIEATALPPGYSLVGREEWSWGQEEQQQIYGMLLIALLLVYMATAALFESLRQPLCVLLTVPMALVGVFLIFFYANASFTREAYIGVIMMGGIVVNNAILLVDHVNRLRREARLALRPAILRGTLERARPILMTSATTILGLLPLVLFSATADANIWNALGYALIGGLTSSTLFVLTVTPALYLLFERGPERRRVERERREPCEVPVSA
ncbi:MAG: efflux RND transporter permease subunit [Gemmatimonadetes bacterium]|nr:efflux RND transporter permease subunit [Gemmatimonadota bacterium]